VGVCFGIVVPADHGQWLDCEDILNLKVWFIIFYSRTLVEMLSG